MTAEREFMTIPSVLVEMDVRAVLGFTLNFQRIGILKWK
jgi:hypothetical protein